MKLLQVMASNKFGGAERFFCRLAKSLSQQALHQTLMVRKDGPYVNELQALTGLSTAPFSGLLDFKTSYLLKQHINQQQPEILLTWMNRATQAVGNLHRNKNYQHVARLGGFYDMKYYRHVDHFIGNTRGITQYLIQQGIPENRVHYISNFVNEQPGRLLKRPNHPLLLSLGRLHTNKAFDTLITAMMQVNHAELWIGGTGPEEATLKQLIEQHHLHNRVKLLGWVQRPEDLLATCDVFICPSRHEPLGNVMLEAWAQHKPVIATQSQGASELIQHQTTGWLTPIDDSEALAHAITTLLSDNTLCNALANNGAAYYHKHYSKNIITARYIELFSELNARH